MHPPPSRFHHHDSFLMVDMAVPETHVRKDNMSFLYCFAWVVQHVVLSTWCLLLQLGVQLRQEVALVALMETAHRFQRLPLSLKNYSVPEGESRSPLRARGRGSRRWAASCGAGGTEP